jgi:O-antigen/teichoic acid export membrane protein
LVGRVLGAAVLGLYAKAYQLLLLPIQQINVPLTRVAVPALCRLQNDPAQYRDFYKKAVLMIAALGMPLVAFLFVSAHKTIPLLLGPQWTDAVSLFRILAPAAFFGTFNVATGWVYLSLGQTDRMFRWGIFTSAVTVAAFFVGVRWGAPGVAAAFSVVFCGLTMGPPSIAYCFRRSPLRPADLWSALWRPAAAALSAGLLLFAVEVFLPGQAAHAAQGTHRPLIRACLLDAALYGLFYVGVWLLLPGGRRFLADVAGLVNDLRAGGATVPPGIPAATSAEARPASTADVAAKYPIRQTAGRVT